MKFKIKPAFAVAGMVLVMFLLLFATNFLDLKKISQNENIYLAVIIIQLVIFVIPAIIYTKYRGGHLTSQLRLNKPSGKSILLAVFTFFLLIFATSLIKLGLYAIGYYSTSFSIYQNFLTLNSDNALTLTYIIITICLMPAFTEEFVFRSVVLGEYTNIRCGNFLSVVLSSLLFAMLHFNLYQLPVYFVGGFILGYLTVITDSIFPALGVHLLNNIFSLLFESQLIRLITQTDSLIFVLFILFILFMIFLFICLQITEDIYYKKGINGAKTPTKQKAKKIKNELSVPLKAFLSPTYIGCIAVFILAVIFIK